MAMADTLLQQPTTPTKPASPASAPTIQITARVLDITEQRAMLFRRQQNAVQGFYDTCFSQESFYNQHLQTPSADDTAKVRTPPSLFYIANKKSQFAETKKLQIAQYLNARDAVQLDEIMTLFDNLYVLDDLVMETVQTLPYQQPVGWQLSSLGLNLLNLPTIGQLRPPNMARGMEQSAAATVLQFFGVTSFTLDKAVYIGHVAGYLFCCYYFAHLGVAYGVTALNEEVVKDYPYVTLPVPQLVRLLQELDESIKANIYQLAVFCAQISDYAIDKRIEKMLITEVNSFNKNELRAALSQRVNLAGIEQSALFEPFKPIR